MSRANYFQTVDYEPTFSETAGSLDQYAKKARQKRYDSERRKSVSTWLRKLKASLGCARCGFNHPAAIHFHHLHSKAWTINSLVKRRASITSIQSEINKCEALCANCHAIEHHPN